MTPELLLHSFALAFLGCVIAIPLVRRVAAWSGAVDRPDQFRRVHKVAIPRLGGLGLALGLGLSFAIMSVHPSVRTWAGHGMWAEERQAAIALASLIVLVVGAVDDARGLRPAAKLAGQTAAVLVLYCGGIRISGVEILGVPLPLSAPMEAAIPHLGWPISVDLPSLLVTLPWFLGCMNVWNLIDGLDGLASGVGILVCSTLMLVAIHQGNAGSAMLGAALAGSLAGFLLFNWHPACIFLGDSGSLVLGMLMGVMGVQGPVQEATGVPLLMPILAMGLPIADTAMAIVRRWVRGLPLSAADRRHIHHVLLGLGLTTRQAALVLYLFTAGLCGVVLLGVAWRNELLALVLGISGCGAFLLVLTTRRDELALLVNEFGERSRRKRLEREAARLTWERVQRIELAESSERVSELILEAAGVLECNAVELHAGPDWRSSGGELHRDAVLRTGSESCARFLLVERDGVELTLSAGRERGLAMDSDIVFRALERLVRAGSWRLRELRDGCGEVSPRPAASRRSRAERGPRRVAARAYVAAGCPEAVVTPESV
jgi:UDP-GlcNAc:undecaprenyl-phosphate GlcNAc-1-phosphate transferase